ncbi:MULTISPECIES: peptide ABC transporter permease [unclassified Mesobacillus]|uniref:peptide ABC transporter permease n=1 Tax=unclassified Mesobacillus TaxID=2675270 RepID=UPI00203EBF46|nr:MULTISPECIES: peptide ABC transporter permease [unclassified Mesobacillus]MCM3124083.1 peptide ABC transporter permease [Mesobacillus sp. MER 33]MCM3233932.1 peptide ABC transporter permease [Mesobacillus sp. MER 48]
MSKLLKTKKFIFGVSFLTILLVLSILNTVVNDGKIRQVPFVYNEDGSLDKAPPYPPFDVFVLGSDMYGYDMLHTVIEGAKYSIGIVLIVAFLRMVLSVVLSYFLFRVPERIFKLLKAIAEPLSFFPQTLIAYFLLATVVMYTINGFNHPLWVRVVYEFIILVLIALPALTVQLIEQKRRIWKEEFIESAITLGGSKRHIYFKHILPQLYEEWILMFGQQFLQVLTLLVHLGVMLVLFGGTILGEGPPSSVTHEWSGLIGLNKRFMLAYEWIVYVPILFFAMTALSVAMINKALSDFFSHKDMVRKNKGV